MKAYKELSYNELVAERDKLRKELVNLRMQKVLGHLDNPIGMTLLELPCDQGIIFHHAVHLLTHFADSCFIVNVM